MQEKYTLEPTKQDNQEEQAALDTRKRTKTHDIHKNKNKTKTHTHTQKTKKMNNMEPTKITIKCIYFEDQIYIIL